MSCQAPPLPDMPKYFGISGPISEDLPEEADLVQTRKLMDMLKSYGAFEDDSELQHRESVVKRLESLFKQWLKEVCLEMKVPETVTENVGGKVLPFGSYYLGVHSKVYIQAKSFKIYEEGMTILAMYSPREKLSWKMPNGESKRFFTPKPKPEVSHKAPAKPKPEVSHKTPATVQPHHIPPASTGQVDRKRKGLLQSEMPAKRMKADKESVSMTKAFTFSKPTLPARISQATKRPCSPNPETSSRKLKCDDSKELLCPLSKSPNLKRHSTSELEEPAKKFKSDPSEPPDELSEEPPAPTKPVTTVKNTIKLHLLRRN